MTHKPSGPSRKVRTSPVDDRTYNLLQALASTLEAIESYEKYAVGEDEDLFVELLRDERRHAIRLMDEVMRRLRESERAGAADEEAPPQSPRTDEPPTE
jgi:uncharacterized protein YifE (UPF0438 family)